MSKKAKTVRELDVELQELVKVIDQLKNELHETKVHLKSKIDALEGALQTRDRNISISTPTKLSKKGTKTKHKCRLCSNLFTKSIDLERHLKEIHSEIIDIHKCNKCDQHFFLEWRLKKHKETHEKGVKFCHFFNNEKVCPFKEFGCKFKHESSPKCYFMSKCKNKMCQYKHQNEHMNSSEVNILDPREKFEDILTVADANNDFDLNNCDYDAENVIHSNYCSCDEISGGGFHACENNEFKEIRGVNIKQISERYDPDDNDFIQIYPCNVCDFSCEDLDEVKTHINKVHSSIEFKISCLCNSCKFNAADPGELVKHLKTKHELLMKKLIKDHKDN